MSNAKNKSGRATEDILAELHGMVAQEMAKEIKNGNANASYLSVVIRFLKDNGIECIGEKNPHIQKLVKELGSLPDLDQVDESDYSQLPN